MMKTEGMDDRKSSQQSIRALGLLVVDHKTLSRNWVEKVRIKKKFMGKIS